MINLSKVCSLNTFPCDVCGMIIDMKYLLYKTLELADHTLNKRSFLYESTQKGSLFLDAHSVLKRKESKYSILS